MTMQNTYPVQQLTPESSDEEKQRAVVETLQQLVSEGMTQEQAQTEVMQMLQSIMQSPSPEAGVTRYGDSMRPPSNIMRERTSTSPKSVGYFRNDNSGQVLSNFNPGFLPDGRISNK